MSETKTGDPVPESLLRRMRELRTNLLRLHKALLDNERADYESVYGQVTSGELLQLVISHERFAWLRPVSELIVRIDEMLDAVEPATAADAEALLAGARALLRPAEAGEGFGRKYFAAIQREPGVVLAHRDVTRLLNDLARTPGGRSAGEMSEEEIDANVEGTFPASDPPAWTLGSDHPAADRKGRDDEAE